MMPTVRQFAPIFAIAATACAPFAPPGESATSRELAGRVAGPAQSCVFIEPSSNLRPLDNATLAYGWGRTIYVNRLRAPCPSVTPTSTMILDVHGAQYCSGDHFRTIEPGSTIPGAICLFGEWVPYRRP